MEYIVEGFFPTLVLYVFLKVGITIFIIKNLSYGKQELSENLHIGLTGLKNLWNCMLHFIHLCFFPERATIGLPDFLSP